MARREQLDVPMLTCKEPHSCLAQLAVDGATALAWRPSPLRPIMARKFAPFCYLITVNAVKEPYQTRQLMLAGGGECGHHAGVAAAAVASHHGAQLRAHPWQRPSPHAAGQRLQPSRRLAPGGGHCIRNAQHQTLSIKPLAAAASARWRPAPSAGAAPCTWPRASRALRLYVHNRPLIHSLLASTFSHSNVLHLAVRVSCINSDHHIRPWLLAICSTCYDAAAVTCWRWGASGAPQAAGN